MVSLSTLCDGKSIEDFTMNFTREAGEKAKEHYLYSLCPIKKDCKLMEGES